VDVDGPGACELWRDQAGGAVSIGQYDDEAGALADLEQQHARHPGGIWRITQVMPSGEPLPVYMRVDGAWLAIGTARTRGEAEVVARDSGHNLVAYRADCYGPNGDESWEILR